MKKPTKKRVLITIDRDLDAHIRKHMVMDGRRFSAEVRYLVLAGLREIDFPMPETERPRTIYRGGREVGRRPESDR